MIRDQEIQRLINYAKGLGLTVSFSSKKEDCCALWYLDNSGIVIYKNQNKTKIETVLSLIHEIAHAKHNIYEKNRQIDKKLEGALDHVEEAEEEEAEAKKRQRKIILDNEIAGTRYWGEIYKETNMKFPIWRLEAAKEFDVWIYEVLYETGLGPTYKKRCKKSKEINKKHRSKKYD
jgi:hypothetical protein